MVRERSQESFRFSPNRVKARRAECSAPKGVRSKHSGKCFKARARSTCSITRLARVGWTQRTIDRTTNIETRSRLGILDGHQTTNCESAAFLLIQTATLVTQILFSLRVPSTIC